MTHVEEEIAQKLEPIAWRCARDGAHDGNGKWHYFDGEPKTSHLAKDVQPLVRFSDARAALAATEERGRIAERERIRLDMIVGLRNWMHIRYGKWITFRSAMRFANDVTKEPTP